MARIHTQKAAKDGRWKCGKCGKGIDKGERYHKAYPYYGPKDGIVRCTGCGHPRPSEITSSDKLSRIYAVQEQLDDWTGEASVDGLEDLRSQIEEARSELEEVSSEYNESADNMEEYFSGSSQVDEIREKADEVESWSQQLDDVESAIDEAEQKLSDEPDDSHLDEDGKLIDEEAWNEEILEEVTSAVSDFTGSIPL